MNVLTATSVKWNVRFPLQDDLNLARVQEKYANLNKYCEITKSFVTLEFRAQFRQANEDWERKWSPDMELYVESAKRKDGLFAVAVFDGPRQETPLMSSQRDVIIFRKGTALFFACVCKLTPVPSDPKRKTRFILCAGAYAYTRMLPYRDKVDEILQNSNNPPNIGIISPYIACVGKAHQKFAMAYLGREC